MKLKFDLEPNEFVLFEDVIEGARPMLLAVTDRAVFFTRERHFARESWFVERIPIAAITQVSLERERARSLLVLSLLIFLGGLLLFAAMAWNVYRQLPGTKISPWPVVFMAIGLIMPFLAKGRRVLRVQVGKKLYKWKPYFLLDQQKSKRLQEGFVEACEKVGVFVFRTERSN